MNKKKKYVRFIDIVTRAPNFPFFFIHKKPTYSNVNNRSTKPFTLDRVKMSYNR